MTCEFSYKKRINSHKQLMVNEYITGRIRFPFSRVAEKIYYNQENKVFLNSRFIIDRVIRFIRLLEIVFENLTVYS